MKRLGRVGLVLGMLTLGGTIGCEEKPDPAKDHRIKGSEHLSRKEWKQAAAEYELSLQADPKQEKVWEKKAYAHMQIGETDQAAASLLKLMEFKTEPAQKVEMYQSLASMYLQSGELDKGEEYFNEALKIDPKNEISLGWIAEIYAQRGGARVMTAAPVPEHLNKALEYYDKVLAINPNSATTYINKRIVVAKFMEQERQQKEVALLEVKENAKKPAVAAEAQARADQHQARMDELQKQFDEYTQKFSEIQKANAANNKK